MSEQKFKPSDARVVLVDGSGYIFRAFFGVRNLSTRAGYPTNATFGFTNMLLRLLNDVDPEYMAVVFDTGAPTFRVDMYPEYKANRPPAPERLIPQFDDIHEVVDAFGLPRIALDGYEADDIIATLVRETREEGHSPVLVISGDKDLLQLVDSNVYMWDTMKDVIYDEAGAQQKMGVRPDQIPDYLGLVGDSSDNIPGVTGIGAKSATQLLNMFETIEDVFENVPDAPSRCRKRLEADDARDMAILSRQLATVATEVELPFGLSSLHRSEFVYPQLLNLIERLEFQRLIDRIPGLRNFAEQSAVAALDEGSSEGTEDAPVASTPAAKTKVVELQQLGALPGLLAGMTGDVSAGLWGGVVDGPGGVVRPQGIVFRGPGPAGMLELQIPGLDKERLRTVVDAVQKQCAAGLLVQDAKMFHRICLAAGAPCLPIAFDSQLASYLLHPASGRHHLSDIASERGLGDHPDIAQVVASDAEGASKRADVLLRVVPDLRSEIGEVGMKEIFETIEMPLAYVLARMESNGMPVDPMMLKRLSDELGAMAGDLQGQIHQLAGVSFNVNSPKQVAEVLFDRLGLQPGKKTQKSKSRSTDSSVLERLGKEHPLPGLILQWRNVMKLKGTYADSLPSLVHPGSGRIHSTFHQAVTATGRLSSSDPNLQNIPARSALGRRIRNAFRPRGERGFLAVDYSQIDLRALAHLSDDTELVSAFAIGADIHTQTASIIFGVPVEDVAKEQRTAAKAINFGIIYGMGPHRLSQELSIPFAEARDLIARYNERFSGVSTFFDTVLEEASKTGFVTTLLGRRRYLPELQVETDKAKRSPAYRSAARMAMNTPVQGSSADILRLAMLRVDELLSSDFPECSLVLQIHDELVFEGPVPQLEELQVQVVDLMERVVELKVPLVVHPCIGEIWADL
ncbi:MAG: DNA polymerase I [Myxococcales bacterium]|nr:DNA polymerase I [Myxococcales bacterium]